MLIFNIIKAETEINTRRKGDNRKLDSQHPSAFFETSHIQSKQRDINGMNKKKSKKKPFNKVKGISLSN
jgi:hypothetical protein